MNIVLTPKTFKRNDYCATFLACTFFVSCVESIFIFTLSKPIKNLNYLFDTLYWSKLRLYEPFTQIGSHCFLSTYRKLIMKETRKNESAVLGGC